MHKESKERTKRWTNHLGKLLGAAVSEDGLRCECPTVCKPIWDKVDEIVVDAQKRGLVFASKKSGNISIYVEDVKGVSNAQKETGS